jgi:hypothetical protein
MLKWRLRKQVGRMWAACMWLTTGVSGMLDNELLGSTEGEKFCNKLE